MSRRIFYVLGEMSGEALRLVALEHFDFGVEICNGLIHVWMVSRHDDGYEILHALVLDHGRLDDVVLALLLTREPTQEQTVALRLLVVGIVAHVKQNVGIGSEKLDDDANDRIAHLRVVGRGLAAAVRQVEPVGGQTAKGWLGIERYGVINAEVRTEAVFVTYQYDGVGSQPTEKRLV